MCKNHCILHFSSHDNSKQLHTELTAAPLDIFYENCDIFILKVILEQVIKNWHDKNYCSELIKILVDWIWMD